MLYTSSYTYMYMYIHVVGQVWASSTCFTQPGFYSSRLLIWRGGGRLSNEFLAYVAPTPTRTIIIQQNWKAQNDLESLHQAKWNYSSILCFNCVTDNQSGPSIQIHNVCSSISLPILPRSLVCMSFICWMYAPLAVVTGSTVRVLASFYKLGNAANISVVPSNTNKTAVIKKLPLWRTNIAHRKFPFWFCVLGVNVRLRNFRSVVFLNHPRSTGQINILALLSSLKLRHNVRACI